MFVGKMGFFEFLTQNRLPLPHNTSQTFTCLTSQNTKTRTDVPSFTHSWLRTKWRMPEYFASCKSEIIFLAEQGVVHGT